MEAGLDLDLHLYYNIGYIIIDLDLGGVLRTTREASRSICTGAVPTYLGTRKAPPLEVYGTCSG